MQIEDLQAIQDETEQIQALYRIYDEDSRLSRSQAAQVEFLTNTYYIEQYLRPGMRILDVGAGTGAYSLYFAKKGYAVWAVELSERNFTIFSQKCSPQDGICLTQGNALDLSQYADAFFDIVLVFGPLYHLHCEQDRLRCIAEAKRVCKPGGKIFFAFITNDMVFLTELNACPDYFTKGAYNRQNFTLTNFPFVFHTLQASRALLQKAGISVIRQVASDGASELLAEKINAMPAEEYAQYLRYHFYICEKPEFLGMTNHLLLIGSAADREDD